MSRAWGYIVVFVAIAVGAGSLLLPMPETVSPPVPAPKKTTATPPRKAPPGAVARAKPGASPKASKSVKPAPVLPKTFPMDDTTRSRQLVKPKG